MKYVQKYLSFILLLLPVVLLPLQWFRNMNGDPLTYKQLGASGAKVLTDHGLGIGIIYVLTIMISILALKHHTLLFKILAKLLFCLAVCLYPADLIIGSGLGVSHMFKFFSYGFYLVIGILIVSVVLDLAWQERHS